LLRKSGEKKARGGRLTKRKGVVPQPRREKRTMQPEDLEKRWEEEGEDIFAAVAQWRAAHPKATLAEIEQAGDRAHESAACPND
jgi:hypothetical protein